MKGILYIVATPIGNLDDMTFRAVTTLKNSDFILAEDTRESSKLLRKYEIDKTVVSYRDQNHDRMIDKIKEKLDLGLNLSLITDAGTPLISDPGFKLVRDLKKLDYKIVPIPGASAVITALSVCGLPTDRFVFLGFLPKSDQKRMEILKKSADLEGTLVIFESPNRIIKLLNSIHESLGDVKVSVARNLTKLKESVQTKNVSEMLEIFKNADSTKGEYVVLVAKSDL